ncbi:EthD domain-containing protein [Dietzia sp. PP-33]|jgi:hypothetical protein|uniref:EthD domain-containing protein n=1 Tax=Dietzia sp. PP-33 TaxID=2957500 RepID=UPI0029BCFB00|nr:EthD domain-containing protein [Dietzia sp. PP-33]MDX2358606.1 EthD domain-containing protein [Dietzia sp. PP-33]
MDQVLAIVWSQDRDQAVPDAAGLRSRIARAVDGPLAGLGVGRYVVNVRDDAVAGAMIDVQVTPRPVLAVVRARVPVASAAACADLLDGLRELGPVSAWSVTGSEPLPAPDPGEDGRCAGMANLAFLRRPGRMDRDEWLHTWLEEHTTVAIETQSTTAYTQHVVVRALTDDAPVIDGIVEEVFPIEATRDLGVFFDSRGSDERMGANIRAMTTSTARFLDDGTVDAIPTGRYVMRIESPRV